MIEIEGTNAFLCFNNELLTFKYQYVLKNKNKTEDPYEIKECTTILKLVTSALTRNYASQTHIHTDK